MILIYRITNYILSAVRHVLFQASCNFMIWFCQRLSKQCAIYSSEYNIIFFTKFRRITPPPSSNIYTGLFDVFTCIQWKYNALPVYDPPFPSHPPVLTARFLDPRYIFLFIYIIRFCNIKPHNVRMDVCMHGRMDECMNAWMEE